MYRLQWNKISGTKQITKLQMYSFHRFIENANHILYWILCILNEMAFYGISVLLICNQLYWTIMHCGLCMVSFRLYYNTLTGVLSAETQPSFFFYYAVVAESVYCKEKKWNMLNVLQMHMVILWFFMIL